MKVDGLGVILVIILLPIILIASFYIGMQVDTIATENNYNTKLLNATYDAMYAFESNTANEELSSVADSMRSIVEASNNVLIDSLATNLGISNASRGNLRPYIPAVLYTMYDGYYIYAPTKSPVIAEHKTISLPTEDGDKLTTTNGYWAVGDKPKDGESALGSVDGIDTAVYGDVIYEKKDGGYTVKRDDAKQKTDYILKPYVQYSARYVKDSSKIDVTINYTLDNYLNIVGTIGDIYYTKTGYLIKDGLVNDCDIDGKNLINDKYNEDDAKEKILGKRTNANETTIQAAANVKVSVNGSTKPIEAKWGNITTALNNLGYIEEIDGYSNIRTISDAETYLKKAYEEKTENMSDIQNLEYEIGKYKAIAYYVSSAIFSNWVYNSGLEKLEYNDIKDDAMTEYYTNSNYESTSGLNDLYYSFKNNYTKIFSR